MTNPISILSRVLATACVLAACPALAQAPAPGTPLPSASSHPLQRRLVERFNDANTTHDGRLTMAQAQAGHLGWIVKNFAAVDGTSKGYVTLADLQAYRTAHQGNAAGAAPAPVPNVVTPGGRPAPGAAYGAAQGGPQRNPAGAQRFISKFNAANTAGNGRLTLDEARAGHMPYIVKNFAAIDATGKGYVTLQDVRAYRQQTARGG